MACCYHVPRLLETGLLVVTARRLLRRFVGHANASLAANAPPRESQHPSNRNH